MRQESRLIYCDRALGVKFNQLANAVSPAANHELSTTEPVEFRSEHVLAT